MAVIEDQKLVDFSTQARRDGILALETASNTEENTFLKTQEPSVNVKTTFFSKEST